MVQKECLIAALFYIFLLMRQTKEILFVVKDIYDFITDTKGFMLFYQGENEYYLSWNAANTELWNRNVDTFEQIEFNPNPLSFTLFEKTESRVEIGNFRVESNNITSIAGLVEELILNCVVIPGRDCNYCFLFRRSTTFPYLKPALELQMREYHSFDEFWNAAIDMLGVILQNLNKKRMLKLSFSDILEATDATYAVVTNRIAAFMKSMPEIQQYPNGHLRNIVCDKQGLITKHDVKQSLYYSGVNSSLLPEVIPFAVGLFDWKSTREERETIMCELTQKYQVYESQLLSLTEEQISRNKGLMRRFRVIRNDIVRNDKSFPGFETPESYGNILSAKMLKIYCLSDPQISYQQGMNDILQPIISSFSGTQEEKEAQVFWCFHKFLELTNRGKFLTEPTTHCVKAAKEVMRILHVACPILGIWLEMNGLSKLVWLHTDFALVYKRTIHDIWNIWIQILCSPDPSHWITYFSAALLIFTYEDIAKIPRVTISILADQFPSLANQLDMNTVARVAMWLYHTVPPIDS